MPDSTAEPTTGAGQPSPRDAATPSPGSLSRELPGSRLNPSGSPDLRHGPAREASGANPLVDAASTLLDTLAEIRTSLQLDPGQLRHFLVTEVRQFQTRAQRASIPVETIVAARYCLCTALDEAAALTSWGGNGVWSARSLLVAFHNETWGGEKFFQLLSRLIAQPEQHRHILELQYYCLALGFRGRYRVLPDGTAQLDTLQRRLHKLLRETGPGYAPPLSKRWRIASGGPSRYARRWLPLWMWLAFAALAGALCYGAFLLATSAPGHRTVAAIESLRLPELVTANNELAVDLQRLLRPEIDAGNIVVRSEADRTVIAIRGDGLFRSGDASLNPAYLAVLGRIAGILNRVPGNVVIAGYTDTQPIRDRRFASNGELSQARATAVAQAFVAAGFDRLRTLTIIGRADAEPVDSNSTAEGRARNRRVEIMLLTAPGARTAAAGAAR
jgi:type VI secretion system protein ImpK